jgi:putative phosphoesterase
MRIAVLSDTHNRYATVERALGLLEGRGVELLIHCGDIEDTDVVELFPSNTHFVFGNCDARLAMGVSIRLLNHAGSLIAGA